MFRRRINSSIQSGQFSSAQKIASTLDVIFGIYIHCGNRRDLPSEKVKNGSPLPASDPFPLGSDQIGRTGARIRFEENWCGLREKPQTHYTLR